MVFDEFRKLAYALIGAACPGPGPKPTAKGEEPLAVDDGITPFPRPLLRLEEAKGNVFVAFVVRLQPTGTVLEFGSAQDVFHAVNDLAAFCVEQITAPELAMRYPPVGLVVPKKATPTVQTPPA